VLNCDVTAAAFLLRILRQGKEIDPQRMQDQAAAVAVNTKLRILEKTEGIVLTTLAKAAVVVAVAVVVVGVAVVVVAFVVAVA